MNVSTNSLVDFEIELSVDEMPGDERSSSFLGYRGDAVDDFKREHNRLLGEAGDGARYGGGAPGQTDDVSLAPPRFSGASRVDADAWLHSFIYYADYKRLNDEQHVQLFKLLMSDAAANWMRALPMEAMVNFKELAQRFSDRFIANAASKNANVAALWGRRQKTNERAEEFVTAMQRIAARIPVNDEDLVRHAIVHGLKDKIRRFVLMSRCTSIEEVMEAARLAEDTADDVPTTADRAMLRQLATQVSAIQEAVNKMANAPAARAPSSDNAVDAIGDSSASGNATSGPPSGRNPAATFRGRVRGGRARGWTPRHPWNGQFGGQPFWPAYGPTMAYAAFPATQTVTPPGLAPQQAPPVVNATSTAHPAMPAAGQQHRWMQTSAPTAPPNSTHSTALDYVNVCVACGRGHEPTVACRAVSAQCFWCCQVGHFARCCPKRGSQPSQGASY